MGSQAILELVASSIIGGLLLLTMIGFSTDNQQAKQDHQVAMLSQEHLISVVDGLEEDIRQIGYCKDKNLIGTPIIISAGADYIAFKTDIPTEAAREGDAVIDTIAYRATAASETKAGTRKLLRRVNAGEFLPYGGGLTQFDIRYYKHDGDTLARPVAASQLNEIISVEMTLGMGSLSSSQKDTSSSVTASMKTLRYEVKNFGKGTK